MNFEPLPLHGAHKIILNPHNDSRGYFSRIFCKQEFEKKKLNYDWVQANTSYTKVSGSIRGLHFQYPPDAEVKLIKCIKGKVFDVLVDLRVGSQTYGHWHSEILSADSASLIYVPEGFAHGFQTLVDDVEMLYFHSREYCQNQQGGLLWNDPNIGIKWPLRVKEISYKDANLPTLNDIERLKL